MASLLWHNGGEKKKLLGATCHEMESSIHERGRRGGLKTPKNYYGTERKKTAGERRKGREDLVPKKSIVKRTKNVLTRLGNIYVTEITVPPEAKTDRDLCGPCPLVTDDIKSFLQNNHGKQQSRSTFSVTRLFSGRGGHKRETLKVPQESGQASGELAGEKNVSGFGKAEVIGGRVRFLSMKTK